MIRKSKQVEIIKLAHEKGYKVLEDGSVLGLRGNILNPYKNKEGYFTISLRFNKKLKNFSVHQLQAYQLYGEESMQEGILVRHLNGISTDNSKKNIAIGTALDNIMDITPLNRRLNAGNPKHDHKKIIADHNSGLSYSEIKSKYKISSKGTISFIVNQSLEKEGLR